MKEIQTTKSQTKPPVDREAVRVLAIELGAREAARRLGLNPNTVLSWAKRDNWKLPSRKGGATKASANAITLRSKPGDVLALLPMLERVRGLLQKVLWRQEHG